MTSTHQETLDRLLHSEGKIERERAVNRNGRWNVLEQRCIGTDRGRVAGRQHVEPDALRGQVARQACGPHDTCPTNWRKDIADKKNVQWFHQWASEKPAVRLGTGSRPLTMASIAEYICHAVAQ